MTWKRTCQNFCRQCWIGTIQHCISSNETDIKDLQVQFVVVDRTVSLLSSIAFDIEQDRIEWESLATATATAFSEVLRATVNHIKTVAVKSSSISQRECATVTTGNPGRPQFYVPAETLEDLLGLGFSMEKISRMFGVSLDNLSQSTIIQ